MPYKDPDKQRAAVRIASRGYRSRKKAESEVAERVLAEHLRIQSITDYACFMDDPETFSVREIHIREKMKSPSFLKSVTDEVLKEFPQTGQANRQRIEAIVYWNYDSCKRNPEETEYNTFSAKQTYARLHNQILEKKIEQAQEWVNVHSVGLPEKEKLYPRAQIEHFANCMGELKEKGFTFYTAREACGERFFSQMQFWNREWRKPSPESMARSRYELGPKFWVEAQKANVDVEFIRQWMMEEREKLEKIEGFQLEWAKSVYAKSVNYTTYEGLVHLFVEQGLSDNQIMERLETVGVTKVIDPSFIREQIPEVRKEAEKRLKFDIDQVILEGILEGLGDDEIVKKVRSEFIIHEDELKEHVILTRKSLREEVTAAEEKLWTKVTRIRRIIKIRV